MRAPVFAPGARPAPAPRPVWHMPAASRTVTWLVALSIIIIFAMSPTLLLHMGFNFGSEGGNPLEKFHPSTFLVFGALGLYAIQYGNPVSYFDRVAATHRLVLIYLIGLGILLVQVVIVQRAPFSPVVDTFLPPALFLLMLEAVEMRVRERLALFIHGLFLLNALIGYYEFLTGHILFPPIGGALEELTEDWRSASLLGHPLTNANMTGAYLLMLVLGGSRGLKPTTAALLFAINFGAMFAFGGRAALVMLIMVMSVRGAFTYLGVAAGQRFDLRYAVLFALAIPVVVMIGMTAYEAGFFDKLASRFVDDNGSATTRLAMFEVFKVLPLQEILFGPDQELVATRLYTEGLQYGIESFEVAFVITYGLVPSLLFFATLAIFLVEVLRRTKAGAIVPMTFFFIVASTSVSLSAKSGLLSLLIIMLLLLMERPAVAAGEPKSVAVRQRRVFGHA